MCFSRNDHLWDDNKQNRFYHALIVMPNQSARAFKIGEVLVTVDRDDKGVIAVTVPGTLPAQFLTVHDAVNHLCALSRVGSSLTPTGRAVASD